MRRAAEAGGAEAERRAYRGVRRRRWGKWVSEIRVPSTRDRLWLGSYATPEAAAVAHDTAVYFLRGGANAGVGGGDAAALNFPERAAAAYGGGGAGAGAGRLSPPSVQRVASDAGMAADAQLVAARECAPAAAWPTDRTGIGIGMANVQSGGASARPRDQDADACARMGRGNGSNSSTSASMEQIVSGEISVDDIEIMM